MKLTIQVLDHAGISEIVDAALEGKNIDFCVFPHTLDDRVFLVGRELEARDIDYVIPNKEEWGEMFVLENNAYIKFFTSGY